MIITITGKIGSGKTTIANFLKGKGFAVIDGDRIGHAVLEQNDVKKRLAGVFGKRILKNKRINRKRLSDIVFKSRKKLEMLNKITHPKIIEGIEKAIQKNKGKNIVIDAALCDELKLGSISDCVILLRSSLKDRIKRTKKSKEYIQKVTLLQKEPREYDYIVYNNRLNDAKNRISRILECIR